MFAKFTAEHKLKYTDAVYEMRLQFFCENMKKADSLNAKQSAAGLPEAFGVSKYADRSDKEFQTLLGFRPSKDEASAAKRSKVHVRQPGEKPIKVKGKSASPYAADATYVNWAEQGVVTPVKNQGQCGSCWAHSAAEQIESQWALNGNAIWEFSPQQIASCTTTAAGCGGGQTTLAYEYLMGLPTTEGLSSGASAPYVQSMWQQCTSASCTEACSAIDLSVLATEEMLTGYYATVTGYDYATPPCTGKCNAQNITLFAQNVATQGPASVCVDASTWNLYTGNGAVVAASTCASAYYDLDHCVQLTGYNADAPNPYWIVRNSWSTDWGNAGAIYLQYDPASNSNPCGIADEATFVTVTQGTAPVSDRK